MSTQAERVAKRFAERVGKAKTTIAPEDLGYKSLRKKHKDGEELSDEEFDYLERHMHDSPSMNRLYRDVTGT